MAVNNARGVARSFPAWRHLASHAPRFLREYGYTLIVLLWMVAAALVTVLAGLWLDMTIGRGYLFNLITSQTPAPTPAQHAAWTARMLAAVALPSLLLAPLGPILLRPFDHVPRRGMAILSAGMLLTTMMTYSQQWHAAFCSARSCSASGIGPLDAVGRLSVYRLAPAETYGMNHLSVALIACLALIVVLLIGHDIVIGRFLPEPPEDESRTAIEAQIEAELNNWKVDDATFGWHDTGIFEATSDIGSLQATGYRIFAANPRATTKLPAIELPEEDDEQEQSPYTTRRFPTYDYTLSTDQA